MDTKKIIDKVREKQSFFNKKKKEEEKQKSREDTTKFIFENYPKLAKIFDGKLESKIEKVKESFGGNFKDIVVTLKGAFLYPENLKKIIQHKNFKLMSSSGDDKISIRFEYDDSERYKEH